MKAKKHRRKNNRQNKYSIAEAYEENFYFVAGYTSAGTPYGITLEEAEEEGLYSQKTHLINNEIGDEGLPF